MKIILIPSSVDPVGVATSTYNLSLLFNTYGWLSDVVLPKRGCLNGQLDESNISYTVLPLSFSALYFLRSNFILFRYLRVRSPSVVHVNGRFILFVSLMSILFLKKHRYVVTVRQFSSTGRHGLFRWKQHLETLILRVLVFRIICVSLGLRNQVVHRLGPQFAYKVAHIPNTIRPLHCGSPLRPIDYSSGLIRIVAAGRLSPEKGFDVLIRAIYGLRANGLKVRCDIYGTGGEARNLNKLIAELGVEKDVFLLVTAPTLREMLPYYDLAVVPSREESFGLVVLEYYDAGLPVVVSDVPGMSEIVINGETGLLFLAGDADDLSSKIRVVINDSRFSQSLRVCGRKLLRQYFPSQKLLNHYLSVYGIE